MAKAYSDAMEAKKRGEMVGWCASNFPVEIPETLGLYVCYPENQAAGIAARGGGERMCNEAEGDGYSNGHPYNPRMYLPCLCKTEIRSGAGYADARTSYFAVTTSVTV